MKRRKPTTTYVFARKDLNMSPGKLAERCISAAAGLCTQSHEAVVVMASENLHPLYAIATWAANNGHAYYTVPLVQGESDPLACLAVRAPSDTFEGMQEPYT